MPVSHGLTRPHIPLVGQALPSVFQWVNLRFREVKPPAQGHQLEGGAARMTCPVGLYHSVRGWGWHQGGEEGRGKAPARRARRWVLAVCVGAAGVCAPSEPRGWASSQGRRGSLAMGLLAQGRLGRRRPEGVRRLAEALARSQASSRPTLLVEKQMAPATSPLQEIYLQGRRPGGPSPTAGCTSHGRERRGHAGLRPFGGDQSAQRLLPPAPSASTPAASPPSCRFHLCAASPLL